MDEWPKQIFLDSNGQKTIAEYILWMANQFGRGQTPENLDRDMIEMIEGLIEDGELIKLKDEKSNLPYYLVKTKSKQDIDKAYALMIKDGYIKENANN